jgi:hypothetical protein
MQTLEAATMAGVSADPWADPEDDPLSIENLIEQARAGNVAAARDLLAQVNRHLISPNRIIQMPPALRTWLSNVVQTIAANHEQIATQAIAPRPLGGRRPSTETLDDHFERARLKQEVHRRVRLLVEAGDKVRSACDDVAAQLAEEVAPWPFVNADGKPYSGDTFRNWYYEVERSRQSAPR